MEGQRIMDRKRYLVALRLCHFWMNQGVVNVTFIIRDVLVTVLNDSKLNEK